MPNMNSRQRILAALNGEKADRVPITEICIWPETRVRWNSEGMPENISPEDYFGLDKITILPLDSSLGLPSQTRKEDELHYTVSDGNGVTFRYKKNLTNGAQYVSSAVTDPDSWSKYRSRLEPSLSRFERHNRDFCFGRVLPYTVKEQYEQARKEDIFTVYNPTEPCWSFLSLLGEEEALCTICLDPDFAEQVMADYTQFNMDMLDLIYKAGYRFDALWVFSDLCYKTGMLFSPDFFRQRVAPYQKKLFNRAKELGMRIIYHSDGYVGDLIPLLIDVGVECVQPLEVRAGNDVRDYQDKYPGKLSFIGNISADAFAAGKEAIYQEMSKKLPAVKASRRYIFHSDHSIPDTVSLENYQYAIDLAKEYLWN
jgi:uroporphyrinogen decarboxylase